MIFESSDGTFVFVDKGGVAARGAVANTSLGGIGAAGEVSGIVEDAPSRFVGAI